MSSLVKINIILFWNISIAWAALFPLPSEIKLEFGYGYNSNFLRFSENEMVDASNELQIMGDSPTFDTPVIETSVNSNWNLKMIHRNPILLKIGVGRKNYLQSAEKKYFNYQIDIAQKLSSYHWIKIGYKYIPDNFLRLYRDQDQIGNPLVNCNFSYERIKFSYSHPLFSNIWGRVTYEKSSSYFSPEFTEFDLESEKIEININHKLFGGLNSSQWLSATTNDNFSYQTGLISSGIDRSYDDFHFGNRISFNLQTPITDNLSTTFIWINRTYTAEDIEDHLHENRTHNQIIITQKTVKKISDVITVSLYYRFVKRSTNSNFEWVENLKSYNQHIMGVRFTINLTDKFYDYIY